MDKLYTNIDQINAIELTYEQVTDYEYRPEQPEEVKYILGLFKRVIKPWKSARWIVPDKPWNYYNDYEVRSYNWYRIQDFPKRLFKKPKVVLHYTNKNTTTKVFETNEELDVFVSDIIHRSKANLQLIIDDSKNK